ncbi:MAG: response regulator transcription factor [Caldimonas sp.]
MKILLIDDHPLVLAALRSIVEAWSAQVEVFSAQTARQAQTVLAEDVGFDLVLLDLHLGDADGFGLLSELRTAYPSMPVIVLSASDSNDDVAHAIHLGAMGFVPKRSSNEVLLKALNLVMTGNIYVPPMSMRSQSAAAGGEDRATYVAWDARVPVASVAHGARADGSLASLGLTPRQSEVLALLLKGQSNKLIARALNLSVETIKDHVAAVLRSLNVKTRTQAVLAVSHPSLRPQSTALRDEQESAVRCG